MLHLRTKTVIETERAVWVSSVPEVIDRVLHSSEHFCLNYAIVIVFIVCDYETQTGAKVYKLLNNGRKLCFKMLQDLFRVLLDPGKALYLRNIL